MSRLEIPAYIGGGRRLLTVTRRHVAQLFHGNIADITSVEIPDTVQTIAQWAFKGYTGLTSIELPKSVKTIGQGAFSGCTRLVEVVIPDSVSSIASDAFEGCTSLRKVVNEKGQNRRHRVSDKPASTPVPQPARSTEQASRPRPVSSFEPRLGSPSKNGLLSEFGRLEIPSSFEGKTVTEITYSLLRELTNYKPALMRRAILPNTVTQIADKAFDSCRLLEGVSIPDSVIHIGEGAFVFCSSLLSVELPATVRSIGSSAFANCSALVKISLSDHLQTIEEDSFFNCSSLRRITIPSSVVSIKPRAFADCESLEEVVLPDSVVSIDPSAFRNCRSLCKVVNEKGEDRRNKLGQTTAPKPVPKPKPVPTPKPVPDPKPKPASPKKNRLLSESGELVVPATFRSQTVTEITKSLVRDLTDGDLEHITRVVLPNTVNRIADSAFQFCHKLKDIVIPDSVIHIGSQAFFDCHSLDRINLPSSICSIGAFAFARCFVLQHFDIPKRLKIIENNVFSDCRSLRRIEIPSSATTLKPRAFIACVSLEEVVLPDSVTALDPTAFAQCTSLKKVVNENGEDCRWRLGLAPKPTPHLSDSGELNVPSTWNFCPVTEITKSFVAELTGGDPSRIKRAVIPNTVTAIGAGAFESCKNLVEIIIPNSPQIATSLQLCPT